jgi:signal transduction histidine kinase
MTTDRSMPRAPMTAELPEGAALCARADVDQLGLNDLRELMRSVTDTTQRLHSTHIALQDQVVRLQRELAEANAALHRSQALAALGEVAAGIAHEVRNPLGSIQLFTQMLAEDVIDRPACAELCGKILTAVHGLDAIVHDVLAFARETSVRPESIDAADLVERSLAGCASLLRTMQHVHVVLEPGAGLMLNADPHLLAQALVNVIRNAIEAMADHARRGELRLGVVRRRIRCPDGRQQLRVIFSVQDSGPGISPDAMDRIFNPFFTTRKTGTGLGLAIVHRIVDAHGGHVRVSNVAGGGARIELCIPPEPQMNQQLAPKPWQRGANQSANPQRPSPRRRGSLRPNGDVSFAHPAEPAPLGQSVSPHPSLKLSEPAA